MVNDGDAGILAGLMSGYSGGSMRVRFAGIIACIVSAIIVDDSVVAAG